MFPKTGVNVVPMFSSKVKDQIKVTRRQKTYIWRQCLGLLMPRGTQG